MLYHSQASGGGPEVDRKFGDSSHLLVRIIRWVIADTVAGDLCNCSMQKMTAGRFPLLRWSLPEEF